MSVKYKHLPCNLYLVHGYLIKVIHEKIQIALGKKTVTANQSFTDD